MRFFGLLLVLSIGCAPDADEEEPWPAWDGERVGFWDPDGAFVVVDVATGERSSAPLLDHPPHEWAFAPGGEAIIAESRAMWFEEFDTTTGESAAFVAGGDCGTYGSLASEPSGDSVAYIAPVYADCVSVEEGGVFLYPSGDLAFSSTGPITEFSWAHGVRMLGVVHEPQPGRWVLTRVDLDNGTSLNLYESGEQLRYPRLSGDGLNWAVMARSFLQMPGWQEYVGANVVDIVWHPTRDELVVMIGDGTNWSLNPDRIGSEFGYHSEGAILAGWPADGSGDAMLRGCSSGRVSIGGECVDNMHAATWSPHQRLLLLEGDEVVIADPEAGELRSLGPGVQAHWAP